MDKTPGVGHKFPGGCGTERSARGEQQRQFAVHGQHGVVRDRIEACHRGRVLRLAVRSGTKSRAYRLKPENATTTEDLLRRAAFEKLNQRDVHAVAHKDL